jgi:hypothetical protein
MSLQVNMCVSGAQHQRPKPALNTVTRSVADVALERRAETGVGGSEEENERTPRRRRQSTSMSRPTSIG